jgi:thiol-disulfide isomerase/thioredoxin
MTKSYTRFYSHCASCFVIAIMFLLSVDAHAAKREVDVMRNVSISKPVLVPNVSFADVEGKTRQLKEFKGKLLVLNFWASWCMPCVLEMPDLAYVQKLLGEEGVEVVALSQDYQGIPSVQAFYAKHKITDLAAYHDTANQVFFDLKVVGLPTTIIIDPKGFEVARIVGVVNWRHEHIITFLRSYLPLMPKK